MSIMVKCQAQNPIFGLNESRLDQPNGYYLKDINNQLNIFEGTYIYTNGSTTFKIQLVKKVQQFNGKYYEDLIIGEYQYKVNGIEKINTLTQINTVYGDQKRHSIYSNWLVNKDFRYWKCPQCNLNELRLSAVIRDVSADRSANFTMRRIIEGGQQVIKAKISHVTGVSIVSGEPLPQEFSLPQGEFTLIKQP